MVGQEKLIAKIDSLTLDTFPHSLLLVGEKGSGKHLIVEYIANHLGLLVDDITDKISLDTIYDMMLSSEPCMYLIDGSNLTDKKENVILKVVEEPLSNIFIVLLCENLQQLLPTVTNRCVRWDLDKYIAQTLSNFTNDEVVLKLAKTPGQVKIFEKQDLQKIISICNLIVDRIGETNYQNVLTIVDKMDFKEDNNGISFYCFVRVMLYVLVNRIRSDGNTVLQRLYKRTSRLLSDTYLHHVILSNLATAYITDIMMICRGSSK